MQMQMQVNYNPNQNSRRWLKNFDATPQKISLSLYLLCEYFTAQPTTKEAPNLETGTKRPTLWWQRESKKPKARVNAPGINHLDCRALVNASGKSIGRARFQWSIDVTARLERPEQLTHSFGGDIERYWTPYTSHLKNYYNRYKSRYLYGVKILLTEPFIRDSKNER